MELNIICPKCNSLFFAEDEFCKKEDCNYDINKDNQYFLYRQGLDSFNKSLLLIEQKKIYNSWKELKKKISFFPFIKEHVELGFYLSLMFGEYDYSQNFLNLLKLNLDKKEYEDLKEHLSNNVLINNQIVNNTYLKNNDINNKDLTIHHLYLLFLKSDIDSKENILKLIHKYDPYVSDRLSLAKVVSSSNFLSKDKFKKVTTFFGILVSVFSITYMIWEFEERKKRDFKLDKMTEVIEQKNQHLLNLELSNAELKNNYKKNMETVNSLHSQLNKVSKENRNLISDNNKLVDLTTDFKNKLSEINVKNQKLNYELVQKQESINDKDAVIVDRQKMNTQLLNQIKNVTDNYKDLSIQYSNLIHKQLEKTLKINKYEFYYKFLKDSNNDLRIENTLKFLKDYPSDLDYTLGLIHDLVWYYNSKDNDKRNEYIEKFYNIGKDNFRLLRMEQVEFYNKQIKHPLFKQIIGD